MLNAYILGSRTLTSLSKDDDKIAQLEPCSHSDLFPGLLQAAKPFSEKSLKYIADLDVDTDAEKLRAHGLYLRPECDLVRKVSFPSPTKELFTNSRRIWECCCICNMKSV